MTVKQAQPTTTSQQEQLTQLKHISFQTQYSVKVSHVNQFIRFLHCRRWNIKYVLDDMEKVKYITNNPIGCYRRAHEFWTHPNWISIYFRWIYVVIGSTLILMHLFIRRFTMFTIIFSAFHRLTLLDIRKINTLQTPHMYMYIFLLGFLVWICFRRCDSILKGEKSPQYQIPRR